MKNQEFKRAETAYKQHSYEKTVNICRSILENHANQIKARILLANALMMQKRFDEAEEVLNKTLVLFSDSSDALNSLAVISLERDRDRQKAIGYLEQASAVNPSDWEVLSNLGQLYLEEGMIPEASEMLHKSLLLNSKNFSVHNGLGMLEQQKGRPGLALKHFKEALDLRPNNQAVKNNLATCSGELMLKIEPGSGHKSPEFFSAYQFAAKGDYSSATRKLLKILESDPNNREVLAALAKVYLAIHDFSNAKDISDKLLALEPNWAESHNIHGFLLNCLGGDIKEVVSHFEESARLAKDDPQTLVNLGYLSLEQDYVEDAFNYFSEALRISENNIKAMNGLAYVHGLRGDHNTAASFYKKMFDIQQDNPIVSANLITALTKLKRRDEALEVCRKCLEFGNPDVTSFIIYSFAKHACLWDLCDQLLPYIHDLLITGHDEVATYFIGANLSLLSEPGFTDDDLLLFHKRLGKKTSRTERSPANSHPNAFKPRSRFRIGYLSADFSAHAVSVLFEHIFKNHDTSHFEIYLYSNTALSSEDGMTAMYRRESERFVSIYGLSDEQVAERIESDGINILIDLGGYTERTRISVLAHRPAPIQMTYLGYPATSGMDNVDYFIVDPYLNGSKNKLYFTEDLLELPDSFICFGYLRTNNTTEPAFKKNGYITFGSLTNPYKLNRRTLDNWCSVLSSVGNSKIYLNHPRLEWEATRDALSEEFQKRGVSSNRVIFEFRKHPSGLHLNYYTEIDISLDTMPLTGGNTTIDALSMGVPVVTLAGDLYHQRISYSIIMNSGFDAGDLVSFSDDEFIAKSIRLANDAQRIIELHEKIPNALEGSVLCNIEKFMTQYEEALISAWDMRHPDAKYSTLIVPDIEVKSDKRLKGLQIISTDNNLSDCFHYAIKERGRWHEKDIDFLAAKADLFSEYLDVAVDPGIYAIPVAIAQIASSGKTFTFREDEKTKSLVDRSTKTNNLCNLFSFKKETTIKPDLVRISLPSEPQSIQWFKDHSSLFDTSNPVILINSANGLEEITDNSIDFFVQLGYAPFHLLPSLGLLVPVDVHDKYSYYSSLYFCKGDKRKRLGFSGLICETAPVLDKFSFSHNTDWIELMKHQTGLSGKFADWSNNPNRRDGFDLYLTALNNLHGAYSKSVPLDQRFQLFKAARGILTGIMHSAPSIPRALTLIRVFHDLGDKGSAVQLAVAVAQELSETSGQLLDEPFLHPLPEWRRLAPAHDEAQWAFSLCLAAAEIIRHPTSFFTPADSRPIWEKLAEYPWFATEAKRIIRLIDARMEVAG